MKSMRFLFLSCLFLLLLAGCNQKPSFNVEGVVNHAAGKTLFFERFGLSTVEVLDSIKLDDSGHFRFKTPLPPAPEFFRLRLEDRYIHLAADSSRTVNVNANGLTFGKTYQLKGSKACENIQLIAQTQAETLHKIDSIKQLHKNALVSDADYQQSLFTLFEECRSRSESIIFADPLSPAAYFALFQRYYDYLLFDPYDVKDNKCYAAVATSWDTYYPEASRTKHLVNMTLPAIKQLKREQNAKKLKVIQLDKASFFEIELPNIYNKNVALSSLIGQVILLDFTAYQTDFSPSRTLYLRELYETFSNKGFTIYQVSLDADTHFWKTSASSLPWVCVREANGVQSTLLSTYNISQIPTYFLLDREGNIVARDAQISDLAKAIQQLL